MKKVLVLVGVVLLAGCAQSGNLTLPSIECKGKGVITGTGSAVVSIGSATNNFALQADCGEAGFVFRALPADGK